MQLFVAKSTGAASLIAMRAITIGIRRETKNRWECRAPLTPIHVQELRAYSCNKVNFVIQPCTRRVFSDRQYMEAGALVNEDLRDCDLIIGVKEVLMADLIPGKQYLFFSHTHKGQPYNMMMLKNVCEKKISLIDYELLTDAEGRRLVAFGAFAGFAGMINCLHGLGDRLLAKGFRTPFLVSMFVFLMHLECILVAQLCLFE